MAHIKSSNRLPGHYSIDPGVLFYVIDLGAAGVVGAYAVRGADWTSAHLLRRRRSDKALTPDEAVAAARWAIDQVYPGALSTAIDPTSVSTGSGACEVVFEAAGFRYHAALSSTKDTDATITRSRL